MRYYIMFGVTAVICLVLVLYHPYIGVYNKEVNIKYDTNSEGYTWSYEMVGDSLKEKSSKDNVWTFKVNKKGITELYFTYENEENVKYKIYYKFKVRGNKIYWIDSSGEGMLDYPNPY